MSRHEDRLQMVIVSYLRAVLPAGAAATLHSIPNEGKRNRALGAKLKAMGLQPGAADLGFVHAGRAYFLECKLRTDPAYGTKRTRQTPEQKDWQAAVEAEGARYAVVRHTDEVRDVLAEWAIPTREVAQP